MHSGFDYIDPAVLSGVLDDDEAHALPADEFLKRLKPCLARFGITRVADITGLDIVGLPVAQAVRPMAQSNAVTQGKASSISAAALGAVLECLEMASGEDLSHFPHSSSETPDLWRDMALGADWPDADTPFVPAWNLTDDKSTAIPRDLISTNFARGAKAERAPILRLSVGLGAGATLASALMHGLLEYVEADARNWAEHSGDMRRIALDASSAQYRECLRLVDKAGLRVAVYDISRGPVTAVKASIMEEPGAGNLPLPAVGYAARFDAGTAIKAALAEAIQARLAVISGAREDITQRFYAHPFSADELREEWNNHQRLPGLPALRSKPILSLRELCNVVGPVFALPLCWEPDLPLAITRVVVPGLVADPMRLQVV